jgi:hypothetical protein
MANASAIFCLNGHYVELLSQPLRARSGSELRYLMERASYQDPDKPQVFCTMCGARTLDACPHCSAPILYRFAGDRAAYCSGCGKPFPWTETALAAAKEFADELEISDDDKAKLKSTFDDLTVDTPRTELAAHRFKKFTQRIGPAAGDVLTKIIVNVATEAAKKGMGL